jgi:hypothetical protein
MMHEVASYKRKCGFISEMALTKSRSQVRGERQLTRDHVKRMVAQAIRTQDGSNYMCDHDPRGASSPPGTITEAGKDEGCAREMNKGNALIVMRAMTIKCQYFCRNDFSGSGTMGSPVAVNGGGTRSCGLEKEDE